MKHIKYIDQFDEWEKEFKFFNPIRVRFSETDMFGHLNNTVPFVYFEESRIAFFEHLGFMKEWLHEQSESIIVVADLQCDFVKQVYFGQNLKVYVKANSLGTSSVDIHYLAKDENDQVCFIGRGTMVQVSKKTGKGVQWSEEMKQAFHNSYNN